MVGWKLVGFIITDFTKGLRFGQNFEGVKRHATKEIEAVGLPERMDLRTGHEQILRQRRTRSQLDLSLGLYVYLPSSDSRTSFPPQQIRLKGAAASSGSEFHDGIIKKKNSGEYETDS